MVPAGLPAVVWREGWVLQLSLWGLGHSPHSHSVQGTAAEPVIDGRAPLFYLPLCGESGGIGRQQLAALLAGDQPIIAFDIQGERPSLL